uniref:Uncharacterized protein n=1 Tax=Arundo donax TaxID=35708 RepID=A0A0A9BDT8_ARUDO
MPRPLFMRGFITSFSARRQDR